MRVVFIRHAQSAGNIPYYAVIPSSESSQNGGNKNYSLSFGRLAISLTSAGCG
jgi:hypothetical protein